MVADGNCIYHGDHFLVCVDAESLCCMPRANIMYVCQLHFNKKVLQFFHLYLNIAEKIKEKI